MAKEILKECWMILKIEAMRLTQIIYETQMYKMRLKMTEYYLNIRTSYSLTEEGRKEKEILYREILRFQNELEKGQKDEEQRRLS